MSQPRFNHVAMSVPASLLDDTGRAEIVGFFREVFDWDEMPTMTKPGQQLVLQAYSYDQFVFLVADDAPMTCPRKDHFGMAVESMAQFEDYLGRAKRFAEHDGRVEIIDADLDDFGVLKLHSFYVGYRLPMMVEVQHWDWTEPVSAPSTRAHASR
jgi:hypothetical protein